MVINYRVLLFLGAGSMPDSSKHSIRNTTNKTINKLWTKTPLGRIHMSRRGIQEEKRTSSGRISEAQQLRVRGKQTTEPKGISTKTNQKKNKAKEKNKN